MMKRIFDWLCGRSNKELQYPKPGDDFYKNTTRDPRWYCKCGQHYYHEGYNDWVWCDADGRPMTRGLDLPGAYHIPNPECCKDRGPEYTEDEE